MPTPPIPIAIIGSGIFVKEQHLVSFAAPFSPTIVQAALTNQTPLTTTLQPAVLATPLLALKAIYSRTLASAQSTLPLLPTSHPPVALYAEDSDRTYAALLARADIAAVIIALPIAAQPAAVEAALRAGKHVLSEKPVGPDVEGARRLIGWYRSSGGGGDGSGSGSGKNLVWSVAEQFRFLPKYVWAAEQASKLGRVVGFHFRVFQLCGEGESFLSLFLFSFATYLNGPISHRHAREHGKEPSLVTFSPVLMLIPK